jgi:putative N6-adenine-specific DNA methylase
MHQASLWGSDVLLQRECPEAKVGILSGNKEVTSRLRMRADRRCPLTIGGVDCRLLKYTVSPFEQHMT